jgi:hypothetical protein
VVLLSSLALVGGFLSGCGDGSPRAGASPGGETVRSLAPDPNAPYVVSAVDYHFHDAHPSAPLPLDQTLIFRSQSTNLHNVTIIGTGFSRNLRPLKDLVIEPISSVFPGPGRYRLLCKFHVDRNMFGTIVVSP